MKIAITDDCKNDRFTLTRSICDVLQELGIPIEQLTEYETGNELLEQLSFGDFDLIFLDIFMDELTGIQTARKIREIDQDVRLVFATSSNEFASESFAVNACHYILKPVTKEKIRNVIQRINLDHLISNRSIQLPDGQKVLLKSIVYSEYSDHIIQIHLTDKRVLCTRLQHSKLENMLCNLSQFFSSSKGIIVNFESVERLEKLDFIMKDGSFVPVSRRKRKACEEAYHEFLFTRLKEEF